MGSLNKEVAIVIVCMNNLSNLFPCLESIIKYNHKVSYEIIVVAYLFSYENLERLKAEFPSVKIILSDEIRGFAENNNLALRSVESPYCMILNDDTIMKMPVVDLLIDSFKQEPDADFFSLKILNSDGSVQSCGNPPYEITNFFLHVFRLVHEEKKKCKYSHKEKIFRTFNLSGAAFMVKTDVLNALNFFDERYFFCPEDIALTTLANKKGYRCYINADISIVHAESGTSSALRDAVFPAMRRGNIIFLGNNSTLKRVIVSGIILLESILKGCYWLLAVHSPVRDVNLRAYRNSFLAVFSNDTPKEIFKKHYKQKTLK